MSKFAILMFAGMYFATPAFSQVTPPPGGGTTPAAPPTKGSVKGVIVDTSFKQNLQAATVALIPDHDSAHTQFVVTDKKGAFLLRYLKPADYHLAISFEGYQQLIRNFTITPDSLNINLGTLYMQRSNDMMEAVVVERPPMGVKKDTIEYNASMYTTKPNAVAEDLLKKFPGIQVDASGNITAQGETVQRVLVDGKRFFSDDPKLATRNLPPDIIDKIQVFDDLDDQSKFSGFDDGNRIKTINITTKKDKRMGYFGRVVAGAGTDQDYDNSINMHRFDNDQQISLLGQANDVNKQNFTIQDILGSSGSRRGSGGGPAAATNQSSPGVTTVWAGGGNYKDSWGPNVDIMGAYFYNFQHVSSNQSSYTLRDLTADSTNTINSNQSAIQRTWNQRINVNLEQKFDSNNSLVFRPNIAFQTTKPNSTTTSTTVDQNNNLLSNLYNTASSTTSGFNINGSNLTLRHKFNKPFRTISLDLTGTANVNSGDGYNYSLNNFYRLGTGTTTDTLNQYYNDSLHSVNLSPTLSYTEPVGKNEVLELNYNHTYIKSTTINNTYDYTDQVHDYKTFDSLFSNSYKFLSNADRISLNFRIQNPKYNFNVGSGVQFTNFTSVNTTKDITVAHNYVNITPTMGFQYSFSKTQRLRIFYQGRTGTPTPSQLQPLITTTDNVNFTEGNPNLKPQFTHTIRALYSSFDPGTQHVIFATINASTIVNDIQTAITYNAKTGQTTTYVNLNGTYNASGFFNYGFALKNPKSNLNFITSGNYAQSQTLVDSTPVANVFAHAYSRNTTLAETVSWTTNIKKNFDMNFSSASTYNIARNSFNASQNLDYFSEIVIAEITAYTNNGWLIAANFQYTYTDNRTPGYNASVPLLSPSIAKSIFKKKNGEIRLTTFDLLNSNTYVNKTPGQGGGYTATRNNTLTRYMMLTFTWNLNKFPGAGQQRRMPGLFPGMFRGGGPGGRGGGGFGPPGSGGPSAGAGPGGE
jgi:outer membrane beta-barrel protein/carboxypeptidase-like protein